MSIMRWDPFGDLSTLKNQMNRFFEHTFKRGLLAGDEPFGPRIDLFQTENEVIAMAELPGIQSKEDVEVTLTPDSLNLRGEFKHIHDINEQNIYHSERFYGSFNRTIPLPSEIKPEQSAASYKNGLLEIRMPKTERGRKNTHKIPIQ